MIITKKPIEIKVTGHTQQTPQEMCTQLLDMERWSEFKGYSILPGIKQASFETKTPGLVGSRIKVRNTDGSSHVEEIIEWDVTKKVVLQFQEFSAPLNRLASHFVETWEFHPSAHGTDTSRTMTLHPIGIMGWLLLLPISQLMKKAFEKNAAQLSNE